MVPHPTRLASQFGLVCASATIGRLLISLAPSLDDLFHEVMQHVLLAARLGPELRRTFAARALDALRELGYPLGPSLQRVVRQALSDQAEASLEMTTTVVRAVSKAQVLVARAARNRANSNHSSAKAKEEQAMQILRDASTRYGFNVSGLMKNREIRELQKLLANMSDGQAVNPANSEATLRGKIMKNRKARKPGCGKLTTRTPGRPARWRCGGCCTRGRGCGRAPPPGSGSGSG